jgi:hypothetical protein
LAGANPIATLIRFFELGDKFALCAEKLECSVYCISIRL